MRRNTALVVSVLGAIAALAFPVSAMAIPALDQYVEQLPGAGGDKPSKGGSGGSGGSDGSGSTAAPISTVSPAEIEELESRGEDGAAAAAAVTRSTPVGNDGKGSSSSLQGEDSDTPLGAVFSAVGGGGSGGMGAGLPILLGLIVIGALALFARSRRKGASGGS
jgi:hypothetical protein